MTAIAIWCDREETADNPRLWIAADSRVTTSGPSTLLIDDAAKIFSLPVICFAPNTTGFYSERYSAQTFGFCFTGSTLMGQNSYLALLPLLTSLISSERYVPSLVDISNYVLAYLSRTFDDYAPRGGYTAAFEVALFGHCKVTNNLSLFHYIPRRVGDEEPYRMTCVSYESMQDKQFVYLGDEKPLMTSRIATAFSGVSVPGRPLSRIPRYVIQDCINNGDFATIGGDLQLGIADKFGFMPYRLMKPRVVGRPDAYDSYLGRELTPDISCVGQARVGGFLMV